MYAAVGLRLVLALLRIHTVLEALVFGTLGLDRFS